MTSSNSAAPLMLPHLRTVSDRFRGMAKLTLLNMARSPPQLKAMRLMVTTVRLLPLAWLVRPTRLVATPLPSAADLAAPALATLGRYSLTPAPTKH